MQVSISNLLKSVGCFHSYSYLCFFFSDLIFKVLFSLFNFSYHKWNTVFSTSFYIVYIPLYEFPNVYFTCFFVRIFLHFLSFFLSFFFFGLVWVLCILGKFHWESFLLYILQIVFLNLLLVQCLHYIWYLYRYKNINWTLTWYSICCSKPFV